MASATFDAFIRRRAIEPTFETHNQGDIIMHRRANRGFTLIELMITVVIISIIAAIAYPSYRMQVMQSRRAEAQAALMSIAQYFERQYSEDGSYSNLAWDPPCDGEDDDAIPAYCDHYDIEIVDGTLNADEYLLEAAPKDSQANDGALYIDQAQRRFWDENNDGDTEDTGENDWRRG